MAKTLYKLDANGSIQSWTIGGSVAEECFRITYGQNGGAMQTQIHHVKLNQSGRSMREQLLLEMNARISKQRDKGYRSTIDEAKKFRNRNTLNLHKPMLAQRWDKIKSINPELCYRQVKYDGHRMLVHNDGEKLIAYSRQGKIIDTLDHILDGLNVPEGWTLDGEVYCHGEALQTIASWCKRKQPNTEKLTYIVYDLISDLPYDKRYGALLELGLSGSARLAVTWMTNRPVTEDLREAIADGYEGLILRTNNKGYSAGKRCNSLVKVKQAHDGEFKVLDIEPSHDGWGILVCQTAEGKVFRVSAPGTIPEKTAILENKSQYIGLDVTVEYFDLTKEKIPFHPVAIRFREDL